MKFTLLFNFHDDTLCFIPTACRSAYYKHGATAANKKASQSPSPPSPLPSTSGVDDNETFSFEKHCFFCGKEWLPETGHIVRRQYMNNRLLEMINMSEDDEVKERLEGVTSLEEVKARYHRECYQNTLCFPPDENAEFETAFNGACQHLEAHKGKAVRLATLKNIMGGACNDNRIFYKKLQRKYGLNIFIKHRIGKEAIFYYRRSNLYDVCEEWMVENRDLGDEQQDLILHVASDVIHNIILKHPYKTDSYKSPDEFFSTVKDDILQKLFNFLKRAMYGDDETRIKPNVLKIESIAHSIISAARPRCFMSHLQLALALYIHRKTGSQLILDLFSKLGVCSSYRHMQLFEASAIKYQPKIDTGRSFVQFVFDNTDHNVSTLDGHETFHCMGGIAVHTPEYEVTVSGEITRCKEMPSATELASINTIPDAYVPGEFEGGLSKIIFVDTSLFDYGTSDPLPPAYAAYFWGHYFEIKDFPSWKGYMVILSRDDTSYQVSRIICMPFIRQEPLKLSTVYTSIVHALNVTANKNQQSCFVTCDHPLYMKGRDLAEGLKDHFKDKYMKHPQMVLGLFHLLMSYAGAIGYVMGGSGIEELFATAPSTVKHMLTGHAFARSMRAHMLAYGNW